MKKVLLAACILPIAFTACKKTSKPNTPSAKLQGAWTLRQTGEDDNQNGKLDASEIRNVDTNDHETFTFNADGTALEHKVISGNTVDVSYHWALVNGGSYLQLVTPGSDTIYHQIISLTVSNLEWEDTVTATIPVDSWHFYTK